MSLWQNRKSMWVCYSQWHDRSPTVGEGGSFLANLYLPFCQFCTSSYMVEKWRDFVLYVHISFLASRILHDSSTILPHNYLFFVWLVTSSMYLLLTCSHVMLMLVLRLPSNSSVWSCYSIWFIDLASHLLGPVFVCIVYRASDNAGLPCICHASAAKTHRNVCYQNDNNDFLCVFGCSWWFHVGCVVWKILISN